MIRDLRTALSARRTVDPPSFQRRYRMEAPDFDPATETAAFATFGPRVEARYVPALVRAGYRVWSFGYGDEIDVYTTIDTDDLWRFEQALGEADADWGPFRLDSDELDGATVVDIAALLAYPRSTP